MATETVVMVDGAGTTFTLGDPSVSPRRRVLELQACGPAEHRHFITQFPGLAGAFRVGGRDVPRMLTLNCIEAVSSRGDFWTLRDDLIALLDPTRGVQKLRVTKSDGSEFEIQGYAWARPEMSLTSKLGDQAQGVVFQLWCPWPYWYDRTAYDAGTNADGTVTATLTLSGTSTVTTSLPYGTAANGFVTGYPHSFTITGQATNVDIRVQGETSRINFNSTAGYTLAVGNTMTITTAPLGVPKAIVGAQTRVDGYVDKATTRWAFPIPLGGGTLQATGGAIGDNGTITLAYRQYKRGI